MTLRNNKRIKTRPKAIEQDSGNDEEQNSSEGTWSEGRGEESVTAGREGPGLDPNLIDPGSINARLLQGVPDGTNPGARRVNLTTSHQIVNSNASLEDLRWKYGVGAGRSEKLTRHARHRDAQGPLQRSRRVPPWESHRRRPDPPTQPLRLARLAK